MQHQVFWIIILARALQSLVPPILPIPQRSIPFFRAFQNFPFGAVRKREALLFSSGATSRYLQQKAITSQAGEREVDIRSLLVCYEIVVLGVSSSDTC